MAADGFKGVNNSASEQFLLAFLSIFWLRRTAGAKARTGKLGGDASGLNISHRQKVVCDWAASPLSIRI
jgi:hypothetical protein